MKVFYIFLQNHRPKEESAVLLKKLQDFEAALETMQLQNELQEIYEKMRLFHYLLSEYKVVCHNLDIEYLLVARPKSNMCILRDDLARKLLMLQFKLGL